MKNEKITSGAHLSYWTDTVQPFQAQPLHSSVDTDVVIIGGGIAGVTIAYCLCSEGRKVVLIEDGNIGSGETGRTTAHLVNALDDRYYKLADIFGEEDARLIAESHSSAIDFIENTIRKENIDCDFQRLDGYLFLHPSDKEESLEKEYKAAKNAGLNVELMDGAPGMKLKGKALKFPGQGEFNPLKYLYALCEIIKEKGGQIYTNTHAKLIDGKGVVTDEGYNISASSIVVATNTPVNNKYVMHLKQYPYRTYAMGALIKKDSLPKALWWDTGDMKVNASIPPYHYVRTHPYSKTYDLLISGGEDHIRQDLRMPITYRKKNAMPCWNTGHDSAFQSKKLFINGRGRYWNRWIPSLL